MMFEGLLFPAVLSLPQIGEMVADGAVSLTVAAGKNLGKGIVQGVAEEIGSPQTGSSLVQGDVHILMLSSKASMEGYFSKA